MVVQKGNAAIVNKLVFQNFHFQNGMYHICTIIGRMDFSKSNRYVIGKYLVKSKMKEAFSLASVEHWVLAKNCVWQRINHSLNLMGWGNCLINIRL